MPWLYQPKVRQDQGVACHWRQGGFDSIDGEHSMNHFSHHMKLDISGFILCLYLQHFTTTTTTDITMPAPAPIAYATISNPLQSRAYITGITSLNSGHLLLSHPSPSLSIADAQTLQQVGELQGGHTQDVVATRSDDGVWSAGEDGNVVRWDERARSVSSTIKGGLS